LTATAEQRERRRIAEGLHDNVQQLLSAARMGMSGVSQRIQSENDRQRLAQSEQWLCEALEATRSLIFELSPAVLYEMGLEPAVRHLLGELKERFNLKVKLAMNTGGDPLNESLRIFLFSAVRELLFNVVKHADTHEAGVKLSTCDGKATLVVQDGGCGFDEAKLKRSLNDNAQEATHLGLKMLKERAVQFGGDLTIDTAPGRGCTITLCTPKG
jgi:signal transduction histidine kinase